MNLNWRMLSAVVVLAGAPAITPLASNKFEKFIGCAKYSMLLSSTSKRNMNRYLEKSFEEFCNSTTLTAIDYWPSSHCIPAQNVCVCVGWVKSEVHSQVVLDSDESVRCLPPILFIVYLHGLDRQSQRVDEDVTIENLKDQPFGSCR